MIVTNNIKRHNVTMNGVTIYSTRHIVWTSVKKSVKLNTDIT